MTQGKNTHRSTQSNTQKFTSIRDGQAIEMNKCLQETNIPEWITKGKTTLIQKDQQKETVPINNRPIRCRPMMWKILTAQIRDEIYYSLINRRLFLDEEKGCCKRRERTTKSILYVPQSWIIDSFKMHSDILRSHKVYREYYGKLESGTDSRKKELNRDLSGRCAVTVIICNSDDATESYLGNAQPHTNPVNRRKRSTT